MTKTLSDADECTLIQDTTKPSLFRNMNELCLHPKLSSGVQISTYQTSEPFSEGLSISKDLHIIVLYCNTNQYGGWGSMNLPTLDFQN